MASRSEVVFRADSSTIMGSGHVMRCLTLADALARQGCRVSFVCRDLPGNIIPTIAARGYEVRTLACLSEADGLVTHDDYSRWLCAPWETDAAETAEILKSLPQPADLLVVDNYAFGEKWEETVRPYVRKLLAIDDLANRCHHCDFLLDQNLGAETDKDYRPLVDDTCTLLLGAPYALLRPEFARLRKAGRVRDGRIGRVLVFFGGGDPTNETGKALAALGAAGDFTVDVVLGASNPHRREIEAQCRALAGATVHLQTDDMAGLMAAADLAIGGCGTATWERCCLGLPSVCLTIAENQEPIAAAAAKAGALLHLGKAEEVSVQDIRQAVADLLTDPTRVAAMAANAYKLVDGLGTDRVIKKLGLARYAITVVSDAASWINDYLPDFCRRLAENGHQVSHVHDVADIGAGDFAFFLGCGQIVPPAVLAKNRHNLVVHESALPHGRGWSPLTWQILEGKNTVPITLLEAAATVDSGDIYLRDVLEFKGDELVDELRAAQAAASFRLCRRFVAEFPDSVAAAAPQGGEATYYPRRTPADSRLDPDQPLAAQFNLLRVADNDRYPAFFEINGKRYILKIYPDGREKP